MGKIVIPAYRVEYRTNEKHAIKRDMIWEVRSRTNVTGYGKPTLENLEVWRDTYNYSFHKGVNSHVSEAVGYILRIVWCRIVHQKTGRVMCTFTAPAFEVV
jgi:hypothetical protein